MVRREGLPVDLVLTAETEDGLVMALEHRRRPWFGVQFHPESILTPHGSRIVANFLALTAASVAGSGQGRYGVAATGSET